LTNIKNKHKSKGHLKPYYSIGIGSNLNRVNNLIHNLEELMGQDSDKKGSNGYFSTYFVQGNGGSKKIKFDDDEYDLFTLTHNWGDLFLGYGTTGKSIYHVFKDKDIALLKKGFECSPQEYVTSNLMCLFGYSRNNYEEEYLKWFDDNKITEKFGLNIILMDI